VEVGALFIRIFVLIMVFFLINKAHSNGVYLKVELPIYKKYSSLNKSKHEEYKKYAKSITDTYGLGLGYDFSNYIETELIFDQMKYLFYGFKSEIGGTNDNVKKANAKIKKGTYLSFASKSIHGGVTTGQCSKIPKTFVTPDEFCDHISSNKTIIKKYDDIVIQMKLQALIASVKFKAHNEGRVIPFLSLGAGVSHMKINQTASKLDESGMNDVPTLKNKTSFAYRVGVGTKIKISSKVALELSARYFDYGKYKLSNDVSKKITGHDFSAGIILGF
jgi:opacity protein-like surface antigen